MIDLTAAGLSETEAKCYQKLLEKPDWKPAELAQSVNETRTNCYKILDKLVSYKLAERFDKAKKLHYKAVNPTRLLELMRVQREKHNAAEKQLELHTDQLLKEYITSQEQPGVQFFQGKTGIKRVFEEMLQAGEDIHLIRSPADVAFYDENFFDEFRQKRAAAGITTYAITPLTEHAVANMAQDESIKFIRTVVPKSAYDASVEWDIYGDKVALISYGNEAISLIIQSQQIADSLRQLFKLIQLRQQPGELTS